MKLRNKKTGEVIGVNNIYTYADGKQEKYNSLKEFNEEWEDYEEPKDYWWISPLDTDVVHCVEDVDDEMDKYNKQIGNYFETREEAEKAVEKLKAIQRLKDIYFIRFDLDFVKNTISFTYRIDGTLHSSVNEERIIFDDMKTIFGGEK